MLRRVLSTVALAALGLAGVASAALTGGIATPAGPTSASATSATATTATATAEPKPTPVPSTIGESSAPSTILVSGRGWGHAVGMSQWGALGFAQHGWSYERILAHYYRGTTLEQRPSPTVRVLLLEGRQRVALASDTPWTVADAAGTKVKLEPGRFLLRLGLVVRGKKLVAPLRFVAGKAPLEVAGKPYRGRVVVHSDGKRLSIVNTLKLEPYLKGVVGFEVPSHWPPAALQAQAVAARTYATSRLGAATARTFDVYADVRSQVYGGIDGEDDPVSSAVDATAGRVLTYAGKPIIAYYSSSTGGRTVSAAEAFGTPLPYLVSVDDPYDTISPNHRWGPVLFDARQVGKALNVSGGLLDLRTTAGPSGRVASVTAVGPGGEVTASGAAMRVLLGLRSTWFSLGWLALDPPAPAAYRAAATLTGIARGAGPVSLEAKTPGGDWKSVATVAPAADGTFSVTVRADATTDYRLAAGDVRGALVQLAIQPVVAASVKAGAVTGSVAPVLPGAVVQLQRQDGAGWSTVATATPDTKGAFAVAAAPGSYRVRWAPRGLAPVVSQPLAVP